MALAGPFWIAAAVLVLAGVWKVVTPRPTVTALRSIGVSVPGALVRTGAVVEATVGAAALVTGSRSLAAYFILVHGPSGRVTGEGTASRWDQVQSLLAQATTDAAHRGRAVLLGRPRRPVADGRGAPRCRRRAGPPQPLPERELTRDEGAGQ